MNITSIEADLKNHKHFRSEGWEELLHNDEHKELAIKTLSQILFIYNRVEFKYKGQYYEVFDSSYHGYVINIYSSANKDEEGCYLEENLLDGGLFIGTCKDAIEFMM